MCRGWRASCRGTVIGASATIDDAAVVSPDQADSAVGDTVTFTGIGFQAGETVNLQVLHTDGSAAGGTLSSPSVVADASGSFQASYLVGASDNNVALSLTSTGASSGRTVLTGFHDAANIWI